PAHRLLIRGVRSVANQIKMDAPRVRLFMQRFSFLLFASLCLLWFPISAVAQTLAIPPNEAASAHMEKGPDPSDFVRTCPPGFNDTPAMPMHYSQATVLKMPLNQVFALGQQTFVTNFNACDGAGRPATTGTGVERSPEPVISPPTCSCWHRQQIPFRASSSTRISATPGSNATRSGCSDPAQLRCS